MLGKLFSNLFTLI